MLRVNSRDVLVVPPFECAWLSLSDYGVDGACCLTFDYKGDNDITLIFKSVAGAKRWQPLARPRGGGGEASVEDNYTVILGSHRNSRLKFEKNGEEMETVQGVAGAKVGGREFAPYWVNCHDGAITVGSGRPGEGIAHRWVDPRPGELAQGVRHVGLSCWDRHVSYRNVRVLPPLDPVPLEAEAARQMAARCAAPATESSGGIGAGGERGGEKGGEAAAAAAAAALPSLFDLASRAVVAELTPAYACQVLQLAELLLPTSDGVYAAAVEYIGRCFEQCAEAALPQLSQLSAAALADILSEPLLSVKERLIFEVVASWACYGDPPPSPRPPAAVPPRDAPFSSGACAANGGGGGGGGERAAAAGGGAGGRAYRPAAELLAVVPLVRFMLMSQDDLQAVLAHPLVRRNPPVQQRIERALSDARAGADGGDAAPCVFERRRLVRPAAAAAAAAPPPRPPGHHPEQQQQQQPHHSPPRDGPPSAAPPLDGAHPWRAGGAGGGGAPADAVPPGDVAAAARYQRRLAPACRELMYVYDGDRNGVIAHIATDYGARQWVNPVLSKRVEVRASSPASRFTDPKALVSGTFPRTSFACPRYEGGQPSSWWLVDLGPSHRLLCNYYTMRQDGSSDFPRHWVLQASNDLQHWVDLRRHIGDATLKLPGQYASWPVSGPASHMPFRAFRLLLAGPTLSATTPWNFCLSQVEFYGYFFRAGGGGGAGSAASSGGSVANAGGTGSGSVSGAGGGGSAAAGGAPGAAPGGAAGAG